MARSRASRGDPSARWSAAGLAYARVGAMLMALVMTTIFWATVRKDGQPFRRSLLTPWMQFTILDFYASYAPLVAWVFTREARLFTALAWALGLCVLGSVGVWLYVLRVLLQVSAGDSMATFWLGSGGSPP